jgi:hypothetical protein
VSVGEQSVPVEPGDVMQLATVTPFAVASKTTK